MRSPDEFAEEEKELRKKPIKDLVGEEFIRRFDLDADALKYELITEKLKEVGVAIK